MILLFLPLLFGLTLSRSVQYPIKFTYVNRIDKWWPPAEVLSGLGVPGYAKKTSYNYFAFAFWTSNNGPFDIAKIWMDPLTYLSAETEFGTNNDDIRNNILRKYHANGIKVLVAAFGDSNYPTTEKKDPVSCATEIASYVKDTNLDGVDVNWEDTHAFVAGTGERWLIQFTQKLRSLLPSHIISHAPQAPYFDERRYRNGGYMTVHKEVGNLIDFYNVQFYNQMSYRYDTYEKLFLRSNPPHEGKGTAVK